ncbi:hypothetical protein ACM61V_14065 [Sphingomonas sp. TX0543]|nr:hypothetical protein [Sphingomonas sp. 3P27F8]
MRARVTIASPQSPPGANQRSPYVAAIDGPGARDPGTEAEVVRSVQRAA